VRSLFRIELILILVGIIAGGTVFFRLIEGWTWLDAYFFTMVTISTVGYGSLVPITPAGKIGATILIVVGIGIFAVAIQRFGTYALQRREEHVEEMVTRISQKMGADNTDPPKTLSQAPRDD